MTASPARARKPSDDRRREIADAALRVIAAGGLGRFTAAALAAEVGVTDGALFRHFPTKDAIVLAAIGRVEELLVPSLRVDDPDPVARLGAFFRARVAAIRANPGISRLLVSDELAQAASHEGVVRALALRRRSVAFVRTCLDEAAARGRLAAGVRTEDAEVLVVGAILALAHAATPGDPERIWRLLESTLRGPHVRASAGRGPPLPTRRPRGR